ncbi:hypothetical protein ES288_A07G160900v1 [Gossypium darwinii]|uniref:Non-specific lipid-transfer protein n=1 Tax=Gossypium darwinii TaxID=34276 RepID=A0A5D2FW52_GOSDA|nr:hypothetical protein ES288_A07G160900v1 [Gossypium darwinii]
MLLLLTLSALAVQEISAAPSCTEVAIELLPCLSFLSGNGAADVPSRACCLGAQTIAYEAQTKDDRRAICECLVNALANIGTSDSFTARIPLIATQCGVDVSLPPITGDKDYCSKYQSLLLLFFSIFHSSVFSTFKATLI